MKTDNSEKKEKGMNFKEDKVYRETVFDPSDLEIRLEEVTVTWDKDKLESQKGKYVEVSRKVLKVYPLIPTVEEEVKKMRLSSQKTFVYKNGEKFFYTELDKKTRIVLPLEYNHKCINCGRCYAHKCKKVGDSPMESIIRNHTATGNDMNLYFTRGSITDDILKKLSECSQRIEKYPFLIEACEVFDNSPIYSNRGTYTSNGARCLIVLKCDNFIDDTHKEKEDEEEFTDPYEGIPQSLSCMKETFNNNGFSFRKKHSPPNY